MFYPNHNALNQLAGGGKGAEVGVQGAVLGRVVAVASQLHQVVVVPIGHIDGGLIHYRGLAQLAGAAVVNGIARVVVG